MDNADPKLETSIEPLRHHLRKPTSSSGPELSPHAKFVPTRADTKKFTSPAIVRFLSRTGRKPPDFCVASVMTGLGVVRPLFSSPLPGLPHAFCACIQALCRSKLWVSAYQNVEERTLSIPRTKNCLRP